MAVYSFIPTEGAYGHGIATIDNDNPSSSTDVDIGKPDIDVTKSSQVVTCNDYGMTGSKIDVVHEGDEIQYTITAENNGVVSDKINVRDELKDKVEKALAEMAADGTSSEISKKWFGEDIVLEPK